MTEIVPPELPSDARAFIPELMRSGYSASGALAFLRANGAGMRTQTFYRTWGEVARSLALEPGMADRPLDSLVSPADMATWRAGRPGTFGFQVNVVLRDAATGLVRTATRFVFSPTNLTPQEAIDKAVADYLEAEASPAYASVAMATRFVNAYQMQGRVTA